MTTSAFYNLMSNTRHKIPPNEMWTILKYKIVFLNDKNFLFKNILIGFF